MPMTDFAFVDGSLDDDALSRLPDELVIALLRAPDTPFSRDNTWVYLRPVEAAELRWAAAVRARLGSGST
ncbi:hypothetical protein [Mycobacterium sp.]|uniref:hypothetical protein n=1 Tax=Mycobacterium sp. TaxID=1785 RepID=UPI002C2BA406|nr:hypothetical protein [Mycobacterium sp.]HTY31438.1 hypothetical protein [Mycobacterium sp.]